MKMRIPTYYVGAIGYSNPEHAAEQARADSRDWPGERIYIHDGYDGPIFATYMNGRKTPVRRRRYAPDSAVQVRNPRLDRTGLWFPAPEDKSNERT